MTVAALVATGQGTPAPNVPSPPNSILGVTAGRGLRLINASPGALSMGFLPSCDVISSATTSGMAGHKFYRQGAPDVLVADIACGTGATPIYTGANIGSPAPSTFAVNRSGVDVVAQSNGLGFLGTADSGASETTPVNFTTGFIISVEIPSIVCAQADAQAGILLRKDNTPGSPMVFIIFRPSGLDTQANIRASQDATATAVVFGNVLPATGTTLWATISGGLVTVYYSSNGNTPNQVQQFACPISGAGLAGVGVASKNAGAICTATFKSVCVQTLAEQLITDSGLSSGTNYGYYFVPYDVLGNLGAASPVLTSQTTSGVLSDYTPVTGAVSAYFQKMPNTEPFDMTDAWGSDHDVFFVNSPAWAGVANNNFLGHGSGIWSGDLKGAYDLHDAGHKVVALAITSGRITTVFGHLNVNGDNFHYNGAPAPGDGLYFPEASNLDNNGDLQSFKHVMAAMGNSYPGPIDNRDGINMGPNTGRVVRQWEDVGWSTDEFYDSVLANSNVWKGVCNSFFFEALNDAGRGETHAFGPISDYFARKVFFLRNYLVSATWRIPGLLGAPFLMWADNLAHNAGGASLLPENFGGQGTLNANHSGFDTIANMVSPWCMAGFDSKPSPKPWAIAASYGDTPAFTPNSKVFFDKGRIFDRTGTMGSLSNVDQNVASNLYEVQGTGATAIVSSRIAAAWLAGYNETTVPLDGSGHMTLATALALNSMVLPQVGARPGNRSPKWRTYIVAQQLLAWLNQTGSNYARIINSETSVGGLQAIPVTAYTDPWASGMWGGNPFPTSPWGFGVNGRLNILNWLNAVENLQGCPNNP